jgi:hypothetical protein
MSVRRPAATLGRLAALVWLAGVLVVAVLESGHSLGPPRDFASSPAGVAAGRIWPLLASGIVVAGPVAVQIVVAGVVTWLVLKLIGARVFWAAAAAGHFGATLVVYAGIGFVWLVWPGDVRGVADTPDYGISCVWLANLGALLAWAARRGSHARTAGAALVALIAGLAVAAAVDDDLANLEHLLAVCAGAAVVALLAHRPLIRPA